MFRLIHIALNITLIILVLFSLSLAEESITITTYYPSPYGSYNELTTASNTYLATTSGNVGIGTTSAIYKLDVNGDINYTGGLYRNGARGIPSADMRPSYWNNVLSSSVYAPPDVWTEVTALTTTVNVSTSSVLQIFLSGMAMEQGVGGTPYLSYRILVDGSVLAESAERLESASNGGMQYYETMSLPVVAEVDSGSHVIKVELKTGYNGGWYMAGGRLAVFAFSR